MHSEVKLRFVDFSYVNFGDVIYITRYLYFSSPPYFNYRLLIIVFSMEKRNQEGGKGQTFKFFNMKPHYLFCSVPYNLGDNPLGCWFQIHENLSKVP
jgi:hypothetical protein